jgi:thioester reductase-like protein
MYNSNGAMLLTGVTGFVGGAIALEILRNTDADLICLVRPRSETSPEMRLLQALHASANMYGITLSESQIARCRAIPGDITLPFGGVEPHQLTNITELWHVAASLAFEEERSVEISLHNEHGTKNIVDLARKTDCQTFNYVSTAYVAGDRRGLISEEAVPESSIPNNHYERSKIAAERIVEDAGFDVTRIFRPSIVIGHSETHVATTFSGLYGFVRGLQRARDEVFASLGDLLKFRPLRLLADGDTPVNFIPVDYVARAAVNIAAQVNDSSIYHLTNSSPPKLADCWASATHVLNMMRPLFVDDPGEFTLIDQEVDAQIDFYRPYMNDNKCFGMSNTESVLGHDALRCPLSADDMAEYVGWYVQHCEAATERSRLAVGTGLPSGHQH